MKISITSIKAVRDKTNISLNACKKALEESDGDIEGAIIVLQKQGTLKAKDRINKATKEGLIHSYIHGNGSMGVLLEVNCETDFAANAYEFREFCEKIALQIAAMNPLCIDEMSDEEIQKQKEIFKAQVLDKPEQAQEKIIEGKIKKWNSEVCLLKQESVVMSGKTIEDLRTELVAKIGENVTIKRFKRWEVGID